MDKRSDVEVGEECLWDHLNSGEIYPGKLCRGGLCNPTRMDPFVTREK